MTKDEAIARIEGLADGYSRFKIGKTGQTIEDRFNSEYADEYDGIHPICNSTNKALIDQWEIDLIEHFQEAPGYAGKCDNDAVGGGDMGVSTTYRIYVVGKS